MGRAFYVFVNHRPQPADHRRLLAGKVLLIDTVNPYESPQPSAASAATAAPRRDRGVLLIALVILVGCLTSIAGFFSATIRDILMPRFGWGGLIASMHSLIFIGFWVKNPTRLGLFTASFMTCAIGVINGFGLLRSGTVDAVQNVFHDRIHSAWLWSVVSYLLAGAYFLFAAFRHQSPPADHGAG